MGRRYVSFVDDAHYMNCVQQVCDTYEGINDQYNSLKKSVVDPFKMAFDLKNRKLPRKIWEEADAARIKDKVVNNAIGDFHQNLLGGVDGWSVLPRNHKLHVDLAKDDNTVFIELKNKYNTLSGSKTGATYKTLSKILRTHPNAICYLAIIIKKNGTSGVSTWPYKKNKETKIKKIWGKKVYELVTGDGSALDETWRALPKAINDIHNSKNSEALMPNIDDWFEYAFERKGRTSRGLSSKRFT